MAEEKHTSKKQPDVSVQITQVTFVSGKTKDIRIEVYDKTVLIPVAESIYTFWREQFLKKTNTQQQKDRFTTMMNVVRAAYLKGLEDAKTK